MSVSRGFNCVNECVASTDEGKYAKLCSSYYCTYATLDLWSACPEAAHTRRKRYHQFGTRITRVCIVGHTVMQVEKTTRTRNTFAEFSFPV